MAKKMIEVSDEFLDELVVERLTESRDNLSTDLLRDPWRRLRYLLHGSRRRYREDQKDDQNSE